MMPKASSVFQAAGRDSTVTFAIEMRNALQRRRDVGPSQSELNISLPLGVLRRNRQFGARDRQSESQVSSAALDHLHRCHASASDYPDAHTATLCLREFARAENAR